MSLHTGNSYFLIQMLENKFVTFVYLLVFPDILHTVKMPVSVCH